MLRFFQIFNEVSIGEILKLVPQLEDCKILKYLLYNKKNNSLIIHLVHRSDLFEILAAFFMHINSFKKEYKLDEIVLLRGYYFGVSEEALYGLLRMMGFNLQIFYTDEIHLKGRKLLKCLRNEKSVFINIIDVKDPEKANLEHMFGAPIWVKSHSYSLAKKISNRNYTLHWFNKKNILLHHVNNQPLSVLLKRYEYELIRENATWTNWIEHIL